MLFVTISFQNRWALEKAMVAVPVQRLVYGFEELADGNSFSVFNSRASKINLFAMEKDLESDKGFLIHSLNLLGGVC